MSAFIVSPATIRALVNWAKANKALYGDAETAQKLIAANVKSIAARYPDTKGKEIQAFLGISPGQYLSKAIAFDPQDAKRPAVEIIKLCKCLTYQSCEYKGWDQSAARSILRSIEQDAIRKLPGYEEAPWGLE